jgi:hypothetical protein
MAAQRSARAGIGTQYNARLRWLTRPDVMRGPRFTSTGPVQEPPAPSPHWFPVWARGRRPRGTPYRVWVGVRVA